VGKSKEPIRLILLDSERIQNIPREVEVIKMRNPRIPEKIIVKIDRISKTMQDIIV